MNFPYSMSIFSKVQSCARTRRSHVFSASNVSRRLTTKSLPHDHPTPPHMNFPSTKLCYHWDTLPPNEAQLVHANGFFTKEPPKLLWSTSRFYSMSFGDSPEVCFLGRSNVSLVTFRYSMFLCLHRSRCYPWFLRRFNRHKA